MSNWPLGADTDRALRARGLIEFFAFARDREARLNRMTGEGRVLFAVSTAEHAIGWEEGRPKSEQRSYPLSWRPVVDRMWDWIRGDPAARNDVKLAYSDFLASPYNAYDEDADPDGPAAEADSTAASAIYAAECCIDLSADKAIAAASNLVDELYFAVQDDPSPTAADEDLDAVAHQLVQDELRRQRRALDLLETQALPPLFAEPAPAEILDALA